MLKSSLGICVGASNIKVIEIDEDYNIINKIVKNHECNPKKALAEILRSLDVEDKYISITGRKFRELVNLPTITEPEATEYALKHFVKGKTDFNAIISLGSENFILYGLNKNGNIVHVKTGNKCASGTGEFFLQQIRRMNVELNEAINLACNSEPYHVSGRCSVFCKSDCTHALNKGTPVGKVSAGLGNMIAAKILELLNSVKKENIIVVGGLTKNRYVMKVIGEKIKNLVVPEDADIFEALGAAIYAFENKKKASEKIRIRNEKNSFNTLPKLEDFKQLVEFKTLERGIPLEGDECILGLDVGSTTTKAVLLRTSDDKILASVYLRTNGNPIKASRECYEAIDNQIKGIEVMNVGLGVTGSGRHIAGLHALTEGIINEIIAHATAATFFDKEVDTILEIGGQDAKYTYLVNSVPCDYAMNEACSAGTGSFLEEASRESLNISYFDIKDIALKGMNPPNFNDQCAAFISSDIKNASHEDISTEDIVAGLVYSICMNYNNRVKGSRKIGNKIFMQGGVCYNSAVPLAMAAILNKQIIVPPEPGLMGAFGVALEIKDRIRMGLLTKKEFSLKELAAREVQYGESFVCPGKSEKCDRGCTINVIRLNGKNYPFGGICNKYYNMMHHISIDPQKYDIVAERQSLLFDRKAEPKNGQKTVGMPKSYYVNMLYPLYFQFFSELGFKVEIADKAEPEGIAKAASSFCFPAELSYGMFMNLIKKETDYIFLPQITELYVEKSKFRGMGREHHSTCVIAQSEPYYLQSSFKNIKAKIISPVLNFYEGWDKMEDAFIEIGRQIGCGRLEAREAYRKGVEQLREFNENKKREGDRILAELDKDKSKVGFVLFGRAYNAMTAEANLGIPRKFASRGYYIIPFDCLRFEDEDALENMNWAVGQDVIKAARFVKKNPQLFGTYVTNFSCGPDSFLVGYFRDIMKTKPSLTLELDSHSADAGINTRIEAFLDIVERYRKLEIRDSQESYFTAAKIIWRGKNPIFLSSDAKEYSVKDPEIKMILPSMGRTTAELVAAAFNGIGINSEAVPLPNFKTLMLGRANTSCKECLPLILTTASLLDYYEKNPNQKLIYFMPTVTGNCRFSQYYVFLERLIVKKRLKNVALFTLNSKNSYAGLGVREQMKLLKAFIVADIMDDIHNALLVLPLDKELATRIFDEQWKRTVRCFEKNENLNNTLELVAYEFSKIKLKYPLEKAKKVLMSGEIYARKDEFSSQEVVNRLAKRDIIVRRAAVLEWMLYVDYIVRNQLKTDLDFRNRAQLFIRRAVQGSIEAKIKKILVQSGLCEFEKIDIDKIIKTGSKFINPAMTSEAILVIGNFFNDIGKHIHGLVSIGPFGCMPTRVTESILVPESKIDENVKINDHENIDLLKKFDTLPFLSIESDGNPFPQIVEARIEAFGLQVERVYNLMLDESQTKPK